MYGDGKVESITTTVKYLRFPEDCAAHLLILINFNVLFFDSVFTMKFNLLQMKKVLNFSKKIFSFFHLYYLPLLN